MAPVLLLILFIPRSTAGLNVILKAESFIFPCAAVSRWKSDPILECHSHRGVSGANGKHIYSNRLRWSEVTKAPVRVLMTHIEFASVSDSRDSLPEVFHALYVAENTDVAAVVCFHFCRMLPRLKSANILMWLNMFFMHWYQETAPSISPNSAIMTNRNLLKMQKQPVNHSLSN